jgi:hypothetical protein
LDWVKDIQNSGKEMGLVKKPISDFEMFVRIFDEMGFDTAITITSGRQQLNTDGCPVSKRVVRFKCQWLSRILIAKKHAIALQKENRTGQLSNILYPSTSIRAEDNQ